jgi:hypothetical protein
MVAEPVTQLVQVLTADFAILTLGRCASRDAPLRWRNQVARSPMKHDMMRIRRCSGVQHEAVWMRVDPAGELGI